MRLGFWHHVAIGACAMIAAVPAAAQQASDPLTRCLVSKTSPDDRKAMIRWVFGAMSASPAITDLTTTTQSQRDALAKQAGALYTRLLTQDCRAETLAILRSRGVDGLKASFGVLGEVAMNDLMTAPAVATELGKLIGNMDLGALTTLMLEAKKP
ncbi:MAG: hypothetical protein ACOY45_14720 [Pseudomonadota bacterium]